MRDSNRGAVTAYQTTKTCIDNTYTSVTMTAPISPTNAPMAKKDDKRRLGFVFSAMAAVSIIINRGLSIALNPVRPPATVHV